MKPVTEQTHKDTSVHPRIGMYLRYAADGLIVTDPDFTIRRANRAFLELTGKTAER